VNFPKRQEFSLRRDRNFKPAVFLQVRAAANTSLNASTAELIHPIIATTASRLRRFSRRSDGKGLIHTSSGSS